MNNVKEIVDQLPQQSGVYIFKGVQGDILYIGKAKNLRSRVRSYFAESSDHDPRISKMVSLICNLEWIVTLSESEALILENQLIKTHHPRYNVMLRDDKTYPYFKLTLGEKFPRLFLTRRIKNDGSAYYGPYVSVLEARQTLKAIRKVFPLRQSKMPLDGKKIYRPCLNYQLKHCLAPCAAKIGEEEYRTIVTGVHHLLKGNCDGLVADLKKRMAEKSEAMEYEEAARLRDQLKSVQQTLQKRPVVSRKKMDRDVFSLIRSEGFAGIQVLFIREGIALSSDFIFFKDGAYDDHELLRSVLSKLYINREKFAPDEILLPFAFEESSMLEDYLLSQRGKKTQVLVPKKGEKKTLLLMAQKNGEESMAATIQQARSEELALMEVQKKLHLKRLPKRVEAFDISNISGTDTVASMVVWEDNQPRRADYRKYKIRTVDGPDDFASMKEVLERRYKKSAEKEQSLPDMIVIDGGKGQLSIAVAVLLDLGISLNSVDLIGLAKGRSEKRIGAERGEEDYEYVIKPYQKNEIRLKKNSVPLFFLQRIRDEAHRFAIEFHRNLRSKRALSSPLDKIEGIGPAKKKRLLKFFGSLKNIKVANVEELVSVQGISEQDAESIHRYFHSSDNR